MRHDSVLTITSAPGDAHRVPGSQGGGDNQVTVDTCQRNDILSSHA